MKKLTLLLISLLCLTTTLTSCGKEEGEELVTDIPVSDYDIQGTWEMLKNAFYYRFSFNHGIYRLTVRNAFTTIPFQTEDGTYVIEKSVITLTPYEGTTIFSPLEAYWNDGTMTQLNLVPMGGFTRISYEPETPEETPEEQPENE